MAGDWLKFEKATPDKPEVFAIASDLDIDPDAVVGKLMRVWSWFDSHTENGNAPSVTSALLDRVAGVSGFVKSMQKCGWICITEHGISLPNFERHCGETAKKRAQNNKRVSKLRARNADSVTPELQKHVPEKRREEKNIKAKSKAFGADAPDADAKTTRPTRKAPADFTVTEHMAAWASVQAPGVNLRYETEKFLDHTFARAITDWPGAWRNWIRKAAERPANGAVRDKSPADRAMRLFHESQRRAGGLKELGHD